jgi:hypothetical protein
MDVNRDSSVIVVDLATVDKFPSSFEDLLHLESTIFFEEGVIRPWYIVLFDDADKVESHRGLYESILANVSQPRLILILRGSSIGGDENKGKLELPQFFRDNHARLRVILLTSLTGIDWAPGSHLPAGLAYWESDLEGLHTTEVLKDALTSDEVLDELFLATSAVSHQLWSIGSKQVWFGRLPSKATADALFVCGHGLVGDDGKTCLLPQLEDWSVTPALSGCDVESDILLSGDGALATCYEDVRQSVNRQKKIFGLFGRAGAVKRIARFPEHHVAELNKICESLNDVNADVKLLLDSTDASNGFDVGERTKFQDLGVQQQRRDNVRQKYLDIDSKLTEEIVNGCRNSIATGHSISPLIVNVEKVIKTVSPKSQAEILKEFESVDLTKLQETLAKATLTFPKNPLMKVAKTVAKIFEPLWLRFVLAILYLWLVAISAFEAFDDGNSSGFYPLPEIVRRSIARSVVVVSLFVTVGVVVVGIIFVFADNLIRAWSRKSGLLRVEKEVEAQKSFIERVALNEWVLSNTRRKAVDSLIQLRRTLELIGANLKTHLIDNHDKLASAIQDRSTPNPAVRKDLNDVAGAGAFRQLDRVVEIIRTDVSTVIENVMALKVYEFKGKSANVPEQIVASIEKSLVSYIKRLIELGPLDFRLALSDSSLEKRKELSETYWTKVGQVTSAVEDTVLVAKEEQFVQFVHPDDLLQLDQQASSAVFLRFAPEPSRQNIKSQVVEVDNLLFTTKTACAGIFRLVGFRDSLIHYEEVK